MIKGAHYDPKDGHYHCEECGNDLSADNSTILLRYSETGETFKAVYDCTKCSASIFVIGDPWEDK